jgi:Spy/CpxP family protein refolding chaperone
MFMTLWIIKKQMKRIKIFAVCLSASFLLTLSVSAQRHDHNSHREARKDFDRESYFAARNAYITENVGLTAKEAAVFIPLDNELMQKKFEVGRECYRIERELKQKESRTEEEYNRLLKCREEMKEKRDQLDREYLEKFKKVLTAEQIVKYQSADRAFFDEHIRDRKR